MTAKVAMRPMDQASIVYATSILSSAFGELVTLTAGQLIDGGAIVQFERAARWGKFGTIIVRFDNGACIVGHYFDTEYEADADFLYRVGRNY